MVKRTMALAVVVALIVIGVTGCRETKDKVVLYVHGWSATGGTN